MKRIMIVAGTSKTTANVRHILLAMTIMAGSLGGVSWINPEIKNSKRPELRNESLSENLDINSNWDLERDTTHLPDGVRKIISDFENELRISNDELIKFNQDIMLNLSAIGLSRAELEVWKKQSSDRRRNLQKRSAELTSMYNSPKWKKQIAELTKASTDFADWSTKKGDWMKAQNELAMQSIKFSNDFLNSPEWKAYQEELLKQVQVLLETQKELSNECMKLVNQRSPVEVGQFGYFVPLQ